MWISKGGAIAAVLLACEAFVLVAVAGAVLYVLIRWTHQARVRIRPLGYTARSYMSKACWRTQSVCRSIVSPLVETEAGLSGVAGAIRRLFTEAGSERRGSHEA